METMQTEELADFSVDTKKLKVNTPQQQKEQQQQHDQDEWSPWWSIPHHVLYTILYPLSIKDIISASGVCRRWHEIASDDLLWKKKVQAHFKIDPTIPLKPGAKSWKSEYVRLTMNIPFVQTQSIRGHAHQVLHVSFSHDGKMFATCSKDGYLIVWHADHPCREKFAHNMKEFNWKYTQFSQFNQSDTLIMVSGVHFGSPHSTSGEIAVFTLLGESHLRCRIVNRPYDIFGAWFSDQYLLAGDLHWLAHLISTSELLLNKAKQEIKSEYTPVTCQLYKFYNKNGSSVRAIMLARCPWLNDANDPLIGIKDEDDFNETIQSVMNNALPCSVAQLRHENLINHWRRPSVNLDCVRDVSQQSSSSGCNVSTIRYTNEYRNNCAINTDDSSSSQDESDNSPSYAKKYLNDADETENDADDDEDVEIDIESIDAHEERAQAQKNEYVGAPDLAQNVELDKKQKPIEQQNKCAQENVEIDEMENHIPKYLIFSMGSKTYTPHQIGIKRVRHVTFPKRIEPGLSLRERIAARRAAQQEPQILDPNWMHYPAAADGFDKIDKIIDLHGHIVGMALSPDHRYLYVNTRPWPINYTISSPLEPPPIAQEIDIHVIDLMTLNRVGNMLRSHRAYTPSTECFFIFLDVSNDYVASGAEDLHAYLWDRYYGVCLAKFRHADIVNCVAFNPRNQEMLITTSDDYKIKVWRSRSSVESQEVKSEIYKEAVELNEES